MARPPQKRISARLVNTLSRQSWMTVRERLPEISVITAAGPMCKPASQSERVRKGEHMIAPLKKYVVTVIVLVFVCVLGTTALQAQTFTKDVAPIFNKSCVSCHHEGTGAPMSLMTY